MSKFQDYSTDMEAQNIAMELQQRYPESFERHNLSRVVFYRVRGKKSKEPAKTLTTGFPYDAIGGTYIYYVLVYENVWELLSDEQRKLAVYQQLIGMHPDGFDEESDNYATLRKKDINDYMEVLCAASGVFNWKEVGVRVCDILEKKPEEQENKEQK